LGATGVPSGSEAFLPPRQPWRGGSHGGKIEEVLETVSGRLRQLAMNEG